jgi:hypothetical protein
MTVIGGGSDPARSICRKRHLNRIGHFANDQRGDIDHDRIVNDAHGPARRGHWKFGSDMLRYSACWTKT